MESEILELKWANHTSNMTSELQDLYINDALLDVTIVCGEFSLKAHKTVLSASSSFFRKLFLDNSCKHPILIMTDIDFKDLKSIVEFMYQGKIHISREELTHFLKIAERLKIKGLSRIEEINLNLPEHVVSEMSANCHCYSGISEPITTLHSQQQNITQVESVMNMSNPRKLEKCLQNDTNQQIPIVKVEQMPTLAVGKLAYSESNTCMHWQSGRIDQPSSSILPDCTLSNSSVSHKQFTPSVSHQLSNAAISNLGEPLNNKRFSYPESQADGKAIEQDQDENTGRNINSLKLHQSQDQSPIAVPTVNTNLLFKSLESNAHSSQNDKTDSTVFNDGRDALGNLEIVECSKDNSEDFNNLNCAENTVHYRIKFCKKSFGENVPSEKQVEHYSKLKQFVCPICKYRSPHKNHLQVHLRVHTGEKPYQCKTCFKGFTDLSGLYRHQRTHTGEKPYRCNVCHRQFSQLSSQRRHERTHKVQSSHFGPS